MKRKSWLLSIGIFLVYALMYLPWAMRAYPAHSDSGYSWAAYPFNIAKFGILAPTSALLALAALITSLLCTLGRARRYIACGILLLCSAAVEIVGIKAFGIECFTPLTYFILASLVALGLFSLLGFRKDRKNHTAIDDESTLPRRNPAPCKPLPKKDPIETKKSWILSLGIFLIFVLMCLPYAARDYSVLLESGYKIYYYWMLYPLGIFDFDIFSTISALLAMIALIVSLFTTFGRFRCYIDCGILLLSSAVAEIVGGIYFHFHRFTPLTYFIVAALLALGVFALLGFRSAQADGKTNAASQP